MNILSKMSNSSTDFIIIISFLYFVYSLWFSYSSSTLLKDIKKSLTKIANLEKCKCSKNYTYWKNYINIKINFWKHWITIFSILFLIISSISFGLTVGSFSSSKKGFENSISDINALVLCIFFLILVLAFVGMLIIISTSMYYDWISSKNPYIGIKCFNIPLNKSIQTFLKNYKRCSIFITFVIILIVIFILAYLLIYFL